MAAPINLVKFQNLLFNHPNQTLLLKDFNFTLQSGDFYFVTGTSGSGKTTLLRLIYGDLKPIEGEISVFGVNIAKIKQEDLTLIRQNIGIIFQDGCLLAHLNVLDNVAVALSLTGKHIKQARYMAKEFLDWMDLSAESLKYPDDLSTGQKQLVALARAVVHRPLLVLADEPTGNLDEENAFKTIRILEKLNESGVSVLCVTHNGRLLDRFKHPVLRMDSV